MRLTPGSHTFGPGAGRLAVRTGRTGAAAKAGHDLLLEVTEWQATLEVADDGSPVGLALDADAASLRVREGTGGLQVLGDDDKASIEQTIDEDVLKRQQILFRSSSVRAGSNGQLDVDGELTLGGNVRPIAFEVSVDGDALDGSAVVKQSDWGIKPYSALFGALKVADEVRVEFEGRL